MKGLKAHDPAPGHSEVYRGPLFKYNRSKKRALQSHPIIEIQLNLMVLLSGEPVRAGGTEEESTFGPTFKRAILNFVWVSGFVYLIKSESWPSNKIPI